MFSWAQETDKMIPWQQEDITRISMHMDAVKELSVLTKDVALHEAKRLSELKQDMTKQMSKQLDAARQNMMQLVDVVKMISRQEKLAKELSIQQFEAAKR